MGGEATPFPEVKRHDGYVVDVPYIDLVNRYLCPAYLSMAAVLHGQPPIDRSRTLSWAELGSGTGVSACMVAAANADVEVWGCDVNPAHIERSRQLAAKASLTNCNFDLASFSDVASDRDIGPKDVDVVVVHGVYSWVSHENQAHIVEFIRQRLRPGGLVYVSYEVATGWASMAPIAEAMLLHAEGSGLRSDLAFPQAVAAVQRLADGGARCFPLGPPESTRFSSLLEADPLYGAHEYLGEHFRPVLFDEVANMMGSADCAYLGSLDPTDHIAAYWVPPQLQGLINDTDDLVLQQMLRDLTVQRALRNDLFRRGLAEPQHGQREEWLRGLSIVGLGKRLLEGAEVAVPIGEVVLDVESLAPLVDALGESSLSVSQLLAQRPRLSLADAVAIVSLLVSGEYAAPEVDGWPSEADRLGARRFNRALISEHREGRSPACLVAPATGAAVVSNEVEMIVVGAILEGVERDGSVLADAVRVELENRQRQSGNGGQDRQDDHEAEFERYLRSGEAQESTLSRLARLGIC